MVDNNIIDNNIISDIINGSESHRSENYVKKHYYDFFLYIKNEYKHIEKFSEALYWYFNNITEYPKCPVCGKPVTFINFKRGYHTFCCNKCNSLGTREKSRQVCLEKYGSEYYTRTDEYKEKSKQTCLEKYGVESHNQADVVKKKTMKTKLERYGDAHYTNREKCKQTKLERYGDEYYSNKELREKTNLERYGNICSLQSDITKEKSKQTCLERYGKEHYTNREKCRQTKLERYGDEYYTDHEKTKQTKLERYGDAYYTNREKCWNTCRERFGVSNYSQTQKFKDLIAEHKDEIQEKIQQTCLEKYGVDSYSKTEEYKNKIYNTKKKNNSFNRSKIEIEFKKYLEDNNTNFIYQYHSDLYPFDCDFYFPDKNIYLEINGNWTHGGHPYNGVEDKNKLECWMERAKTSDYYKNAVHTWTIRDPKKISTAKENGINLQVFYGNNIKKLLAFCRERNLLN